MEQEISLQHGVLYTYIGKGCRCSECKAAMREYSANYRSTPEGRERSLKSSRKVNYMRRRAIAWVKEHRPDLIDTFELDWKSSDGKAEA
jgi:hypothetical protein